MSLTACVFCTDVSMSPIGARRDVRTGTRFADRLPPAWRIAGARPSSAGVQRSERAKEQGMPGRIAMISEHASPLAATGSVDAGGQNIYVAHTAQELARRRLRGRHLHAPRRRSAAHASCAGSRASASSTWTPDRPLRAQGRPAAVHDAVRRARDRHRPARGRAGRRATRWCTRTSSCRGWWRAGSRTSSTFPTWSPSTRSGRVRLLHHGTDDFPVERGVLEEMVMDDADAVIAECPQDARDLCTHYACDAEARHHHPVRLRPGGVQGRRSRRGAPACSSCRPTGRSSCSSAAWCRARAWTT